MTLGKHGHKMDDKSNKNEFYEYSGGKLFTS